MNLGQLRQSVYDQIGLDSNDGLVTPAVVTSRLNRALHAYVAEGEWPWLQAVETITTVAGTDIYTPGTGTSPTNFPTGAVWHRTEEIRDDTARVVEWFSPTELDDRWTPTDRGKPTNFAIFAEQIILRPTPDAAYTLLHRFSRTEIDLVSDTDIPTLPAPFHEALVDYAAYLCFRRSRETERMTEALTNYKAWITKMRSRSLRRTDLPGKVRIRPGAWL